MNNISLCKFMGWNLQDINKLTYFERTILHNYINKEARKIRNAKIRKRN